MFKKNALLITILLAYLSLHNCKDVINLTDVQKPVENTNLEAVDGIELTSAPLATLIQLRVKASNSSDAINNYKCVVGYQPTGRLACTANDSNRWHRPHDIELTIRCPRRGSGVTLSYVEIVFSVMSSNVDCRVNEGAVGLRYIGITVNAWNTLIFNYSAKFYGCQC